MKTIYLVTGSNHSSRTRFISHKGESPFTYQVSSNIRPFSLSIDDALSKNKYVYIDTEKVNDDLLNMLTDFVQHKNVQIISYFLTSHPSKENFPESERDFGLFLQLPHRKIYFNYFPKN